MATQESYDGTVLSFFALTAQINIPGMHTGFIGQCSAFPVEVVARRPCFIFAHCANRLAAFILVRMQVLYESSYTEIQKRLLVGFKSLDSCGLIF